MSRKNELKDLGLLKVTISRTADGLRDYMQIITADQFSLNVVLIGQIEVTDLRGKQGA